MCASNVSLGREQYKAKERHPENDIVHKRAKLRNIGR